MLSNLPFFPPQGSTHAASVDALYLFFVAVTAFFSLLIATLVVFFAVRYRRRDPNEVGAPIHGSLILELTWTFIPLVIAMVMFVWGASLYFQVTTPPSNAMEVYVVGKRWMWKAQHVSGQREINELHVPVGQPVKLIIGSEDVLHAYWVPAFRMKMDAVPGRTTTMWFEASKAGTYQLFCAEYCGMSHSRMIGKVTAMEPAAFQTWLAGGKATGTMADLGAKVFTDLGCVTCHMDSGQGRGPSLKGVFGSQVTLSTGQKITADEAYVRESILTPQAKMVAGFPPLMPTFQGVVSEEQIAQLTAYIKSLATAPATTAAAPGTAGAPTPAQAATPQPAGH
ncbi:MAG: cytochrome c oxidase subunit II [Geminicoccaceae bacterium]